MRGAFLLAIVLAAATPAMAQLTQADLVRAVTLPPAGARLPDVRLSAVGDSATTLAEVAEGKPLVLLFADFTCRHLCGPGLVLTAGALADTRLTAGRDYRLAVIGLDPRDGADAARRFAAPLARTPAIARAATVLTGSPAPIAAATAALGYGHVYDAGNDQFAHDASVYVFAADGRLAATLPEMALTPAALRAAIGGQRPATLGERVVHLCYGLSALTGRYDGGAVMGLRLSALAMLAGGAALLLRRRGQKQGRASA